MIQYLFNLLLNIDEVLISIVQAYGTWVYPLLFLIIFLETGLVITPFLPGDSMIFAAGAIAAIGKLNIILLFVLLASAAILGDTVNYWIGKFVGLRIVNPKYKKYICKTERFYKDHGGKTLIFARFIPFIRTFAPFVAGIGKMNYLRFLAFNIAGGIFWTGLFVFSGYFFGNLPFVKENLSIIILLILSTSFIPVIIELVKKGRCH